MQYFDYQVGPWRASASVRQVDNGKFLATIRISENGAEDHTVSQHTIVFEHDEGKDTAQETRLIMQGLLSTHYET